MTERDLMAVIAKGHYGCQHKREIVPSTYKRLWGSHPKMDNR